jgi:propanol-preferring alcohol dehydrogenase
LRFTDRGFSYPLTPGHEIVGRVYRIGSRVSSEKLNVNDLVLVYPWIGCGSCDRCLSRQYHLCDGDESQDIGFDLAGGFSDYVLVPDVKYLVPLNLQDFTDPLPLCVLSCMS